MSLVPLRSKLRVEEPHLDEPKPDVVVVAPPPAAHDLDYWRKLAVQAGERLQQAEMQARALRAEADEARARFGKYKGRLDSANARVNDLQAQLIAVSAERDQLRSQLAGQDVLARKVHAYRESLLHGPIWDLFTELVVCPPEKAGEKEAQHV